MTDHSNRGGEPSSHTTVNVQPERGGGGGGFIALLIGGLVVVVAIIAVVLLSGNNPAKDAADTRIDVDVNLPPMDAPRLPEVEPPTLPTPGPAPSN
ncbi:hypothetical protein [Brevundimonas subvibrioides]|uniref:hypothetical protein n=1 Tax=Brevundimonas subvibrioides TaxID=74313 RepID=UPI0022B317BB|nr:hypothetical protein [Brevundimonas subvibrioides]